ncbi:MAG TPA: hypothetical protein VH814_15390 [Steroidobacteraceae bacterium]|jgi:hypothetical protein
MADTDDTSKVRPSRNPSARARLEQTIEGEREQLLQAHGVLTCLYEVLLHAEGDDAVTYAQTAHAAACLINRTIERLDSVRLKPLLDAMENWIAEYGDAVREPQLAYRR